jgi:hypothetical protein
MRQRRMGGGEERLHTEGGADESDDRDYEVPTRLPATALLLGA